MKHSGDMSLKLKLDAITLDAFMDYAFFQTCEKNNLDSFIVAVSDENLEWVKIVTSCNYAYASLAGSLHDDFQKMVKECYESYTGPHVHSLSLERLDLLKRGEPSKEISQKLIFVPVDVNKQKYYFIGLQNDLKIKQVPSVLLEDIEFIFYSLIGITSSEACNKKINILERYVKEAGHDIASSVQATISKLSNIYRNKYQGNTIYEKAKEAYDEIMSAYSTAEGLGFAVDPDYNVKDANWFEMRVSIQNVVGKYISEARERNINVVFDDGSNRKSKVLGDRPGLEIAIGQYLLNAIKYAYGSTTIYVNLKEYKNDVLLEVVNKGIPIKAEDVKYLWDFGFRGDNALERHVNGSGIGLYTVKKIISAHGGVVGIRSGVAESTIIFSFRIPKDNVFDKLKLLT